MSKEEEIRQDLVRHIRHCAQTYNVKQDEVMAIARRIVYGMEV